MSTIFNRAVSHCTKCLSIVRRTQHTLSVSNKDCILTGLQPTGDLHLGNYFGAVKRVVQLQDGLQEGQRLLVMIADLHSLTSNNDANVLRERVVSLARSLLAAGVDPKRCVMFVQSAVPRHAQLCWLLTCLASYARVSALPQFKEKSVAGSGEFCLGLAAYPVLQAADVLLYKASHVPVGADQLQHLQLAAQLVKTFHHRYKCRIFPTPRPIVGEDMGVRVRSLRNPNKKMSKSDTDPKSRVLLNDADDVIRLKIRKAVTDCTPHVSYEPETRPGVSNLVALHCLATDATPEEVVEESQGLTTDNYKKVVAEALVGVVSAVRQRAESYEEQDVLAVLRAGATDAALIANRTYREVAHHTGLWAA